MLHAEAAKRLDRQGERVTECKEPEQSIGAECLYGQETVLGIYSSGDKLRCGHSGEVVENQNGVRCCQKIFGFSGYIWRGTGHYAKGRVCSSSDNWNSGVG